MIIQIGPDHFDLRYIDPGILRPEDRGLWRANRISRNAAGDWFVCDDDDYLIDSSRTRVIAKETGWDLRREKL